MKRFMRFNLKKTFDTSLIANQKKTGYSQKKTNLNHD